MAADRLLFGIGGLAVGIIIGFMFANSINRNSLQMQAPAAGASSNIALPSNHPAAGTAGAPPRGGALPQVAETIERAKTQPDSFDAQMAAGDLYYKIQRYADAAGFYEKALRIKPGDIGPMIKLGNAYFDAEQYEQAEQWYADVLEKTPGDTGVRTDLGLTYFLRTPRNIEKAVQEFQTVLAAEPEKEITLQNLALAYRESGDTENYSKTIERLKSVNAANPMLTRTP